MAKKYLNQYEAAIDDLGKSIASDEKNVEFLFNRSQCYIDIERYEEAARDLTKAISLEPNESK